MLCSVVQCVAVCYSVVQCVSECCRVLQCMSVAVYVAECCSVLQCMLQCASACVAVCCGVLRCIAACVAMCCSVIQSQTRGPSDFKRKCGNPIVGFGMLEWPNPQNSTDPSRIPQYGNSELSNNLWYQDFCFEDVK